MATKQVVPNAENVDAVETETDQKDPKVYSGKVTRKIDNLFSGEKVVAEGTYTLPIALTEEDASNIEKGKVEDILFWYNFGRKMAARAQVNAALGFDLGSDVLNEKFAAFSGAMANLVNDKTTPERRKKVIDFILGEPEFADLKAKLDGWKPEGRNIDFAVEELKKPSGQKGRPAKVVEVAETPKTEETPKA